MPKLNEFMFLTYIYGIIRSVLISLFYTDVVAHILGPVWAAVRHCQDDWTIMGVFIAVRDDVSETRNLSWVQLMHFFPVAREVRVMGSHLNNSLGQMFFFVLHLSVLRHSCSQR